MKKTGQVIKELNKDFLIVGIDFYVNGKPDYFVFKRTEVDEDKITKLYETYNELYEKEEFTDCFENFLEFRGISYDTLTFFKL